jgi:DnaJ-class molecular chaperone
MGQEICMECRGRKSIKCPECGGTGKRRNQTPLERIQGIPAPDCDNCEGNGWIICPNCEGKGYLIFY